MNLEKMMEISKDLELSVDETFCGYLRKPILYENGKIIGHCSLMDKYCSYVPPRECDECRTYKHYFDLDNLKR